MLRDSQCFAGYGNIFKALPASSLLRVLRLLSKDHPEALSRMLWALNPASTALLTQAFQSVEQEPGRHTCSCFRVGPLSERKKCLSCAGRQRQMDACDTI